LGVNELFNACNDMRDKWLSSLLVFLSTWFDFENCLSVFLDWFDSLLSILIKNCAFQHSGLVLKSDSQIRISFFGHIRAALETSVSLDFFLAFFTSFIGEFLRKVDRSQQKRVIFVKSFAYNFNLFNSSDLINAWNISVKAIRLIVESFCIDDLLSRKVLNLAINGWDEGNCMMSGWLDSESNKVENTGLNFFYVDFFVPNLNVNDHVVSKAFQVVQNETLLFFVDSLLWLNRNNFELAGNVVISQWISLFKYLCKSIKLILNTKLFFLHNCLGWFFGIKPTVFAVETLAKYILLSFF